jgi:predicted nuclease of predicted toxin-antitoxin system
VKYFLSWCTDLLGHYKDRIVITKDNDFVQSFLLTGRPPKLLLVSTGNIRNTALENLVRTNLTIITEAFEAHRFI